MEEKTTRRKNESKRLEMHITGTKRGIQLRGKMQSKNREKKYTPKTTEIYSQEKSHYKNWTNI